MSAEKIMEKQNLVRGVNVRYEYIDYLRIISTFAVVVLHVSAQNWYTTDITSKEWNILNLFDSMVRWSVPVFVMISGALLLDRRQNVDRLYKKKILHIVSSFFFWSIAYTVYQCFVLHRNMDVKDIIIGVFTGLYHMWFCF